MVTAVVASAEMPAAARFSVLPLPTSDSLYWPPPGYLCRTPTAAADGARESLRSGSCQISALPYPHRLGAVPELPGEPLAAPGQVLLRGAHGSAATWAWLYFCR